MREILNGRLWTGNSRDARDAASVLNLGIEAVIDLAIEERPATFPREIISCRFPLVDGDGNDPATIVAAVETTARFVRERCPTLVACSAGMSRSPLVAAAALSLAEESSFETAIETVAANGPCDFSPGLLLAVERALKTLR